MVDGPGIYNRFAGADDVLDRPECLVDVSHRLGIVDGIGAQNPEPVLARFGFDLLEPLFGHLRQRWQDLFGARFEVLLYDLTSTYFESDPPFEETDKRQLATASRWLMKFCRVTPRTNHVAQLLAQDVITHKSSGRGMNLSVSFGNYFA